MPSAPAASLDDQLRKLRPETIRANLVRSGLFLAGWELLKMHVVDSVRSFYLGTTDAEMAVKYKTEVVARHKKLFEASLLWLVDMAALTQDQAAAIRRLRECRNELAHELPKMLIDPAHDVELALLRETKELLDILGRFWCRVEIDCNPDFDGRSVADADISSGLMSLMNHLLAAAEDAAR